MTHRRHFLATAAALAAPIQLTLAQAAPHATDDDARFVFALLRGGLDGLAAVPAVGDPAFESARGVLARYDSAVLPLGATPFALHPALTALHAMYGRGEVIVLHAVGLPYRERSHFDAQQVLESGGTRPHELATGWLGRALAALAPRSALALTTAVPLVLRGSDRIDTWSPSALAEPSPDLVARLQDLYASDPALRDALARARALREGTAMGLMSRAAPPRQLALALARRAGAMLAAPNGPRVAVLEMGGWDTHVNQMQPSGALSTQLRALDAALDALRESLGAAWRRSVVLVATEFGREVAANGTLGSDHGSGGAAFVLGGAVAGGRVIADWPGLAKAQRHEGRDLRTTTDLRAAFKGVLADHLRLPASTIEDTVLPGSGAVRSLSLLA